MKRYKTKAVITAVQITDSTFDNPHPNREHVIGVTYHPVGRFAVIDRFYDEVYGQVGDWLLCKDNLPYRFITNEAFNRDYKDDSDFCESSNSHTTNSKAYRGPVKPGIRIKKEHKHWWSF